MSMSSPVSNVHYFPATSPQSKAPSLRQGNTPSFAFAKVIQQVTERCAAANSSSIEQEAIRGAGAQLTKIMEKIVDHPSVHGITTSLAGDHPVFSIRLKNGEQPFLTTLKIASEEEGGLAIPVTVPPLDQFLNQLNSTSSTSQGVNLVG